MTLSIVFIAGIIGVGYLHWRARRASKRDLRCQQHKGHGDE
jgi:hypothetical protein